MKNVIRLTNFIVLNFLLFANAYSQKEGLAKYTNENLPNKYDSSLNLPGWLSDKNTFAGIWFKDSCVVYELRIRSETSESTPQGTVVKKSYPVWRYIYLDLRTMICQDYHTFKDTATPFCNYVLKPNEPTGIWKFFTFKKFLNRSLNMFTMADTTIDKTFFKRIKVPNKYYPQNFYKIYYIKCDAAQNIFHLNDTLDEIYPGCKSTISDFFDSTGKLLIRDKYEIIRDKLTAEEENIFKQWQQNAKKIKLPLLTYEEAMRSCVANPEPEIPTIIIEPLKELLQAKSNIKPDDVKEWLQRSSNPLTPHKNEIIKKVLENALFDKMYVEPHHEKENLIIVPLKKEYFSQHAKSKNAAPLQYLLLVENSKGEIRRSDIVLFYSTDTSLTALPKNSFHYFFNGGSLSVNGTFTLITLGDVKQYEMDFKNWQKKEFRMWQDRKQNQKISSACSDWYLITTIYHEDGTISQQEKFLGATCTGCAPNEVCDTIDTAETIKIAN